MIRERLSVGVETSCKAPLRLEQMKFGLCRFFRVDSLLIPDHYMSGAPRGAWSSQTTPLTSMIPSADAFFEPLVMLGMMAARYRRVRLGTGVTEPFRRHPMTLAQAFVTLDHISRGRAIMGIGNGEWANTEPYGIPFKHRIARFEEALTIIRLLWQSEGEPVDFDGEIWKLRGARFETPLFGSRPPAVWVAAHAPKMLGIAGRYGDGWYPTVKMSADDYRQRLDSIAAAASAAQRSMKSFEPAMQIFVVLGSRRELALESMRRTPATGAILLSLPGELWERHGLQHPLGNHAVAFGASPLDQVTLDVLDRARLAASPELLGDAIFAGTVDEVVEEIKPLVTAGLRHVVIANLSPMVRGPRLDDIVRLGLLISRLRRLRVQTVPGNGSGIATPA